MGPRRKGRELAVQALYQLDVLGTAAAPQTLRAFWEGSGASEAAKAFGMELVAGVSAERARIDELIAATSQHWRIERLSLVDVCVLRLATYELLQSPRVPTSVVLDEAIEVARRFGNAESAAFVNGVLDAIATRLGVKDERARSGDANER